MKNSFFAKITATLLLTCLTLTGCTHGQQGTIPEDSPEETSEVIAVETVSDPMPVNVSLGDGWCYLRFNLTRERLEELASSDESITLCLPNCTPDDNAFNIHITQEDVTRSLQLLDNNPEQQSVNLIKSLSIDALNSIDKPQEGLYIVYYLLTIDDVLRMLDNMRATGSDTLFLRQRLDIEGDDIAEFHLSYFMLTECLEIMCSNEQSFVPYICPIDPPGKKSPGTTTPSPADEPILPKDTPTDII